MHTNIIMNSGKKQKRHETSKKTTERLYLPPETGTPALREARTGVAAAAGATPPAA